MLKKILLAGVVIGPTVALSNIGDASQWGVGLPLGAVFLALYLIVTFIDDLEHERDSSLIVTAPVSTGSSASGKEIPLHA